MKNDNVKENQIKSEVEANAESQEGNVNIQNSELLNNEENNENLTKNSFMGIISANILDQVLIAAGSAVLLLLCDFILKLFGYMFIRETGSLAIAVGIIYFILNCIYAPIMGKTKMKNTIARKILNIN